jgi:hypothetical protein
MSCRGKGCCHVHIWHAVSVRNYMVEIEALSYIFVSKKWHELGRRPVQDRGFEDSFREYIYSAISPGTVSHPRDLGFGLSFRSFSSLSHELDIICTRGCEMSIFELKHYSSSNISKELIFTFLGKVVDFYLRNAFDLRSYKITMYFVTISRHLDESIRKLCLAYGIKLIEPTLMTFGSLLYFVRDAYERLPDDSELKSEIGEVLETVEDSAERYDYSFSEIFAY